MLGPEKYRPGEVSPIYNRLNVRINPPHSSEVSTYQHQERRFDPFPRRFKGPRTTFASFAQATRGSQ